MDASQMVNRKMGTGTGVYGLYVSLASVNSGDDDVVHHQFFLARNTLCQYNRSMGFKRAAWKLTSHADIDAAYQALRTAVANMSGLGIVPIGPTVLMVELTDTDMQALDLGQAPPARFLGTSTMERIIGGPVDLEAISSGS